MTNSNDAVSDWEKLPLSYGGVREFDGRKYHVVHAKSAETGNSTSYFDVETGLLAGTDVENTPGPPGRMTMSFDDYKRFGPIRYATRMTTRAADGREMVTRVISLDHDPIPSSRYELPPAIKQLASKP